jgi:arylsulfatase A-like enzyme
VTLDTTRADALGAYGQPRDVSPKIDRLAREGVLFEQVVSSAPSTLPSHATIFTGKQPYVHGVRSNARYVLADRNVTLAEVLRDEGYRTGAEIASPVLGRATRIARGFEEIRDLDSPGVELERELGGQVVQLPARPARDISRGGIEFLRRHRDEAFFLWLHYFDAHHPYVPQPAHRARSGGDPYLAEIAAMDAGVGEVVAEIERLGLRERTWLVVTADHGEGRGDHGEDWHSFFVYQSTIRVPLVFWGPGSLASGKRIASLVRTADIAPTLLDLLGLPPLAEAQGVSLRALLGGDETDLELTGYGESIALANSFSVPPLRFLARGRWKYIHKVNPELYDLASDPGETRNLAAREPERVARLQTALRELVGSAPDKPAPQEAEAPLDAQQRAMLAALGYAPGEPTDLLRDEVASLELVGEDVSEKIEDLALVTEVVDALFQGRYARALEAALVLQTRNPNSAYILGLTAQALSGLERDDEAIPLYRRALALSPCDEESRVKLGQALHAAGRYAEQVETLAADGVSCQASPERLNNLAWALATSRDDSVRDGARAVEIAERALALVQTDNPAYLDTLAAAHAESGDFEAAVGLGSRALRTLESMRAPEAVLTGFREHLEEFRAGRALRDP